MAPTYLKHTRPLLLLRCFLAGILLISCRDTGRITSLEGVCYQHAKSSLFQAHWSIFSSSVLHSNQNDLIKETFFNQNYLQTLQLLLDPSVMPIVIKAVKNFGDLISHRLLYFVRTWCYNIHTERMTQLGLLKFR